MRGDIRRFKMILDLDIAKKFLRVDYIDDDDLILGFIKTADELCREITRLDDESFDESSETIRAAAMYVVSYLYDNRDMPNFGKLKLNLRAMLSGIRKGAF